MKKQFLYIGLTLLFFSSCSQRLVVSTPSEKHTLKESNTLYYLNDEAEPFSGRFVKQFYESSNIKEETNYVNGIKVGKQTKYYDQGAVIKETNYELKKRSK